MSDIFVSYSSMDKERIYTLVNALEQKGWSVFWDHDIPTGRSWRNYIGEALINAKCILVVWSENSVNSSWVMEEANEGMKKRNLIPVFLDSVEPPIGFRSIQTLDITDLNKKKGSENFEKLFKDIHLIIGESKSTYPSKPNSYKEVTLKKGDKNESIIDVFKNPFFLSFLSAVIVGLSFVTMKSCFKDLDSSSSLNTEEVVEKDSNSTVAVIDKNIASKKEPTKKELDKKVPIKKQPSKEEQLTNINKEELLTNINKERCRIIQSKGKGDQSFYLEREIGQVFKACKTGKLKSIIVYIDKINVKSLGILRIYEGNEIWTINGDMHSQDINPTITNGKYSMVISKDLELFKDKYYYFCIGREYGLKKGKYGLAGSLQLVKGDVLKESYMHFDGNAFKELDLKFEIVME